MIINIMINDRRWKSLTPQQQQIFRDAMQAASVTFVAESLRGFSDKKDRARSRQRRMTAIEPAPGPWRAKRREAVLDKP